MTGEPTLQDAVNAWSNDPDNDDQMIEFVGEYGVYDSEPLTCHEVGVDTGDDIWIYVGDSISDAALNRVTEFVREHQPRIKQCYANAAELFQYDNRFQYIEGVTANVETGSVHNHAWNNVNGTPVDVTRQSYERYGILIPPTVLMEAISLMQAENQWSVIQNPIIPDELRPPYCEH